MEKRFTKRLEIPLTESQYQHLKARADARGLALTIYVRLRLEPDFMPFTPEPIPPYEVPVSPPSLGKSRHKLQETP
jgi:hypothetical protein